MGGALTASPPPPPPPPPPPFPRRPSGPDILMRCTRACHHAGRARHRTAAHNARARITLRTACSHLNRGRCFRDDLVALVGEFACGRKKGFPVGPLRTVQQCWAADGTGWRTCCWSARCTTGFRARSSKPLSVSKQTQPSTSPVPPPPPPPLSPPSPGTAVSTIVVIGLLHATCTLCAAAECAPLALAHRDLLDRVRCSTAGWLTAAYGSLPRVYRANRMCHVSAAHLSEAATVLSTHSVRRKHA